MDGPGYAKGLSSLFDRLRILEPPLSSRFYHLSILGSSSFIHFWPSTHLKGTFSFIFYEPSTFVKRQLYVFFNHLNPKPSILGVWAVHFPQDRPLISAYFNNVAFLEKQNQFNHPSPSISPVDHSNFNYQSENFYREYLEYSLILTTPPSKIGQKVKVLTILNFRQKSVISN